MGRQLRNHILPAMGEVRLGEATTPLVDKVIAAIKADVGGAAATNMARSDPVWWENDRNRRKQAEREVGPA